MEIGDHMKEYFLRLYTKTKDEYYRQVSRYMDNNEKKFIITANPESFNLARSDNELELLLLDPQNDIVADGISIVKCAKKYGINVRERITGIDLANKVLELANNKKKSLYLFGAEKEVLDTLTQKIRESYPKIKILGTTDGYVEDKDKVLESIVKLNPDVCLVALGIPMQEKLIGRYIEKAKKGIYIGVGGSFDVMSGIKKRAPKIFIKLNLEWLYRIIKEPSRLKRFYNNNIKFMFSVLRDKK